MKKPNQYIYIVIFTLLVCISAIAIWVIYHKNIEIITIIPSHFPKKNPEPTNNISSEEGIELGKKLFYDANLSTNGSSCGSCHPGSMSFAVPINKNSNQRDVLPLINLAWRNTFFWDGGGKNLESAVFGPLRHPKEVGADLFKIGSQLSQNPKYKLTFKNVFGTDTILPAHISRALAQYIRSLTSTTSPYDLYMQGDTGVLSQNQIIGMKIFMNKCNSCHTLPLAATDTFFRLLPAEQLLSETDPDNPSLGRYRISGKISDLYAYRPPSLRNLNFTAPYMHDGRFKTLDETLGFYEKNNPIDGSSNYINELEKLYLKEFLLALSDSGFVRKHNNFTK